MDWIEVRVTVSAEASEAVAHLLIEEGAGGVVEEAPATLAAYFPDQGDVEARLDRIRRSVAGLSRFGLDPGPARVEWRRVAEESWADAWKEHFHPLKVGRRIVVRPTWREYRPAEGEVVIDLDPGMAFGTGSHPTTALCLRALEDRVTPGCVVYDVGTGSGILAIAAVKLGASRVEACDVDPVAVRVAQANAAQNGVGARVRITRGDWTSLPPGEADLVVANIIADVVIELAAGVHRLGRPGALFIASGVIAHRVDDVVGAFREAGFSAIEIEREGEWAAIIARLRGAAT